jgi:hypothetical protein
MANTFELIASSTVGLLGASSIDFTSIPSTYTDIVIKATLRTNNADTLDCLTVKPNNSAANMTYKFLRGDGTSAASASINRLFINGTTSTANTFSNSELYFTNYSGSSYKSISADSVNETNATGGTLGFQAFLWSDTSAITSIILTPLFGSTFLQYSTAYLYGVKNA